MSNKIKMLAGLSGLLMILPVAAFKPEQSIIGKTADGARQKIAVVSIYLNKSIDASQFASANLASMVNALANNDKFKLDSIVADVHHKVMEVYLENLEFDFLPEEEVFNTAGYDEHLTEGSLLKAEYMQAPPGYVRIHKNSKKSIKKTLEVFKNVDGIMIVSVDYTLIKKVEIAGFGTAKVQAYAQLKIVDRNGKKLLKASKSAQSDDNFKFALGGVFDVDVILPLVRQATDKVFAGLDEKLVHKQK